MSKIYDEMREIEVGYLCEKCLTPLEDSPPLAKDFRVEVGRTKRLCPTCAEREDLNGHIAANHRGDDPDTIGIYPCTCHGDLLDERDRDREEVTRQANKRAFEILEDSGFVALFKGKR
jgi:hypothetical protein